MKAAIRGAAVAAALVLGLTGCQEGGSPAAGGGLAPSFPGETRQGSAPSQVVRLDPTALMHALPVEESVSDVMVGGDPFMVQGTEAVQHCAEKTGATCAGLVAVAGKDMEVRGDSDGTRMEFRLYSFETAEQAGTAMKSLADTERKSSAEHKEASKPVTVASGADKTDAFVDDATAKGVMRIGTVVAYLYTTETEPGALEHIAKVQVQRVRTVAEGKNPGF